MKTAIFGGTGFVGSYLVDAFLEHGHEPVLLVRPGSEHKVEQGERCTLVPGDIRDPEAIARTLEGAEAAVYNIGILRENRPQGVTFQAMHLEGAQRVIDAAVEAGSVKRFLMTSANGVDRDATAYQHTKLMAERHLEASGLAWTIFRPSVLFGDPRGRMEFATQLRDQLVSPPLPAPLFYEGLNPMQAGRFKMAPVHAADVAALYPLALEREEAAGQIYSVCGPLEVEWRDIIRTIADAVGTRKIMVPVPALPVKLTATVLESFPAFPLTRDQLVMLLEGNTCDADEVFSAYGIAPRPFTPEELAYLT
jgi:NADH dehydrogenase